VPAATARLTLREQEARILVRALRDEGWRVEAAARRLGMPRSSLYHKIKVLGLRERPALEAERSSSVPPASKPG
jgi:transcriptional regulator of acetoin/glycerol metabolism